MTDQELLELAAKAAGIEVVRTRLDDPMNRDFLIKGTARNIAHDMGPWNPLTEDGDALRLAVKLRVDINEARDWYFTDAEYDADPYAATRRAIVRAAAEIGKTST